MKILCVSDRIDPLIYNEAVKLKFADTDLVLSAGDLPAEYLEYVKSALDKPLLFVHGNRHGCCRNKNQKENSLNIDGKVRHEAGLVIAGLGGSMRYDKGENQFSDFQMTIRMLKMFPALVYNRIFRGRFPDIFLTHASPRGIHDRDDKYHQGYKCFLWFIKVFRPRYLVHGHIHHYDPEEPRVTRNNNTLVINACGHYLIDTGENT